MAAGGDINLNIRDSTKVIEYPYFPSAGSLIAAVTFGTNKGGSIKITSGDLEVVDGALIATDSLYKGDTGNISIKTTSTSLTGYNSKTSTPSIIDTLTSGSGKGGDETINTKMLLIADGGKVESSTLGTGDAGSLVINSVITRIVGSYPAAINTGSAISSSAIFLNPQTNAIYEIPGRQLNGKAGDLTINTSLLLVQDGGQIYVKNDGPGDAGILKINAGQILLRNGDILASTNGGNGGSIALFTNSLVVQNGKITASAKGTGNGGNIDIASILLAGNSKAYISANAVGGLGGKIDINTQGLIFDQEHVTATSDRGAQYGGNVNINFSTSNFSSKSELTQNLILKSPQITCSRPLSTLRNITADALNMPDDRLEAYARANRIPMTVDANGKKTPWLRVQGWVPSANGMHQTVAVIGNPSPTTAITTGCGATTVTDRTE